MEFHQGRLIDHLHLRVANLGASHAFYSAILQSLGREFTMEMEQAFASDELFVTAADGQPSRVHLAFQAASREQVRDFHAAGLAAGGRCNGHPGERAYHPGYYAAYLLDPDGNNLEAVHRGPTVRSAASVLVRPAM